MSIVSNLLALLSLDANDYLSGLDASQAATSSFTDKLSSIGGAVVVGGLTAAAAAVTAVGAAAWEAGNTIDGAMDGIAVKTGATGQALKGLEEDFNAVFSSVPTEAQGAAEVIGQLNSQLDMTGKPLQNLSKQVLELSRLTGGEATASAQTYARVMGDWSIPTSRASTGLDQLFTASQITGAQIDELMQRVVQYGAPMRGFGMSFESTTALLAKWQAEGVNVETVMGGLRIAAGKFNKDGVAMETGLWKTVDAIKSAKDGTDALTIATKVFGAKAAVDLVDTIRGGKFDIDELTKSMRGADGAILKTAASTADWGEKWKLLQNKITIKLAPLGNKLMEAAGQGLDALIGIFDRPEVETTISAFADFAVGAIGKVVAYIPLLIDGFFQLVTWLQNNQGIIVGILAALGVAVVAWAWTTISAAVPAAMAMIGAFWPVILVLGLVGGAAYLLYQAWQNNWGGIQQKTAAIWARLKPIFDLVATWLQKNIPVALQILANFWTTTLLPAMEQVWDWMSTVLFPFLGALFGVWITGWGLELKAFAGLWVNYLWPALQRVAGFVAAYVIPVILAATNILFPWKQALAGISDVIKYLTAKLLDFQKMLNQLSLPDWLTPGSPTPWEIALWGIGSAMQNLAGQQMPKFSAQLALQPVAGTLGIDAQPRAAATSSAASSGRAVYIETITIDLGSSSYSKAEIENLVKSGVEGAMTEAARGDEAG